MASKYYKENEGDQVWWLDIPDDIGAIVFSFDKKNNFDFFKILFSFILSLLLYKYSKYLKKYILPYFRNVENFMSAFSYQDYSKEIVL